MNKPDPYGILKNATHLLPTLRTDIDNRYSIMSDAEECRQEIEKVKTQYAAAEAAQIAFIRNVTKPVNRVLDLLQIFRDSCYALGGLGARYELLTHRIFGQKHRSEQTKFDEAIRSGTHCTTAEQLFESIPGTVIYDAGESFTRLGDMTTSVAEATFCGEHYYDNDTKALVSLVLMSYLENIGSCASMTVIERALQDADCTRRIVTPSWETRPLLGYFMPTNETTIYGIEFGCEFVLRINKNFTSIFTSKLAAMFATSKPGDADYFLVRSLKNTLYNMSVSFYFGYGYDTHHIYHLVSCAVNLSKAGVLTKGAMQDAHTFLASDGIVVRRADVKGGAISLNLQGLQGFCSMIEALGLGDDMPSFSELASIIHSAA